MVESHMSSTYLKSLESFNGTINYNEYQFLLYHTVNFKIDSNKLIYLSTPAFPLNIKIIYSFIMNELQFSIFSFILQL